MAYLNKANIINVHENIVTWRKMLEIVRKRIVHGKTSLELAHGIP
jgi:hypothetical protein